MSVSDIIKGIKEGYDIGGGVDNATSIQALATIDSILGAILGIAVVVLAVGLPLIIALEICYINIPLLRSAADKISDKHDILSRPVGLAFRDARKALKEANTVKTGRSANAAYLRIKAGTIILAVVILAMCMGPINIIIRIVTGIVIDIIQALF